MGEGARLHQVEGRVGHLCAAGGIGGEMDDRLDPGLRAVTGQDQTRATVLNDFARAAAIAYQGGQAAGLRFHHGLTEGIGEAGKHEEVGGGVEGGKFVPEAIAQEAGAVILELLLHLLAVWAVADDHKVGVNVLFVKRLSHAGPDRGEQRKVLFDGNPAAIKDFKCFRKEGVGAPHGAIGVLAMERDGVTSGGQRRDAIGVDAQGADPGNIFARSGEHTGKSLVETSHAFFGDAGHHMVIQ